MNVSTRKHLSRRTVLRGAGAAFALPLLDAMVPAHAATRHTAAAPVKRFAEDMAERLTGVREVNNNLKVKPTSEVLGTGRSGASVLGLHDTPPTQSRK